MKRFGMMIAILLMAVCVSAEVKYIFYFIGDGMGTNQVLGAEMYRSAAQGQALGRVQTLMSQMPYSGQISTYSASNGITDSAAAGTCLASGHKTNNGTLGLNAQGDTIYSIATELKKQGWGVGIMTSVAIDHATPGAFYAHVKDRNAYYQIGLQLSESGFDFFGGAGFHHPQGKNDDLRNLYHIAEEKGYRIAWGKEQAHDILSYSDAEDKMVMVQQSDFPGDKHGDNLRYRIDRKEGDLTLAQIVETAIPFLEKRYERFFMMVEGGMIDYAGHSNDARTAIEEVWDMNEALQHAYTFYLEHPDETLILITADHETGGMALGNSDYTLHFDLLAQQKCSSWVLSDLFSQLFKNNAAPTWEQVQAIYREQLGFWGAVSLSDKEEQSLYSIYKQAVAQKSKDTKTMYKSIHQLGDAGIQMLNKKARVGWTSHSHTAHAVPVFAIGVGAERFSGWHDNTEIVPLIRKAIE